MLFLYIFSPLEIENWGFSQRFPKLFSIVSYGVVGMLTLLLSQFVLRPVFRVHTLTIGQFIAWFLLELLLLVTINFFVFGDKVPWGKPYLREYFLSFKHTSLVLILPYSIALLYLSMLTERAKRGASSTAASPPVMEHFKQLHFKDENDKEVLSVKLNHLLFLKSESNYTAIYYLEHQQVKKILIRTNLKKLESDLDSIHLIRTHRSYMINLQQVLAVNRKGRGYQLTLTHLRDTVIPVSPTYMEAFDQKMKRM